MSGNVKCYSNHYIRNYLPARMPLITFASMDMVPFLCPELTSVLYVSAGEVQTLTASGIVAIFLDSSPFSRLP